MDTDLQPGTAPGAALVAYAEPVDPRREQERLRGVLDALVGNLQKEADDRVAKRNLVEERWLEDLRQLHGEYPSKLRAELEAAKRSTLFVNETRPKTNACEARLFDMLFPTDDKNWGIQPTPVPELSEVATDGMDQSKAMIAQANAAAANGDPSHPMMAQAAQQAADVSMQAKAIMDEAAKRAKAMETEIEDQLTEGRYAAQMREVIRDACRIGTGVCKGPVANTRARQSWAKGQDGAYSLAYEEDPRPAVYRVDPWGFFPEPDARTVEESADFYERHLLTPKDLRALARQPGFDAAAIGRLLKGKPTDTLPTYVSQLREITGVTAASTTGGRFQVWEYRGPLAGEQMRDLCACMGKPEVMDAAMDGEGDDISLPEELQVCIWFSQGEVLKVALHHMDSGEPIYSVFNLEKDDASVWGFGIPYLMRDAQRAINGAWRMMMDNAGLSTGPQIEVDMAVIEPADGNWEPTPRKIWLRRKDAPAGKPGIITYDIPSHQNELAGIIQLAKQLADDETSINVLTQGEQGSHTTKTAQGMALLMNSQNVIFRRFVKNFDDDVTVPNIRRLYHWNMQFSPKENIKGDFEVDARGSSVLLVREMQAQNLMVLANMTAHPRLGPLIKDAATLRRLVQSMMVPADELVMSDEEIQQKAEEAKNAGPPPDPAAMLEMQKLQVQQQLAEMDAQVRIQVAQMQRETELAKLAQMQGLKLEELRSKLGMQAREIDSKERVFAAEAAFKDRQSARETVAGTDVPDGTRFAP